MSPNAELYHAIREHSGLDWQSMVDAGNHGADGGFSGFIYTLDCAEFYRKNSAIIDDMMSERADDMGYDNVAAMWASFGRSDMLADRDSRDCLFAWFALEETGRWIDGLRS